MRTPPARIAFFFILAAVLVLPLARAQAWFGMRAGGAATDPTVGVLPAYNDVYANWQNAGLLSVGGIPNRTTLCPGEPSGLNPTGVTPGQANDDAAVINAAISACPAGDVLQLNAGIFHLIQSEYIALNNGITLRGSSSCANASSPYCPTVITVDNGAIADWTISASTAGANCGVSAGSASGCTAATGVILLSPSANYNWGWGGCNLGGSPSGCGTALAADAAQGQTTIQVASTSKFSVGMAVLIAESPVVASTANPTGGAAVLASSDWLSASGSPATLRLEGGDIPGGYSFYIGNNQWLNQEIHIVKAIGAGPCPGTNCTLTFDDPLTLAFRESGSHDARVFWPTVQGTTANPFLQYAGVENLSITRPGNGGIDMEFCAYCWVKNVEVGDWIAGAVNVDYSVRSDIEGNYFHDCYDCENNGAEYPVGISAAATETYVANNIIVRGGKGMVGRAANTAVVAYNYVDDTFYMASVIGDYWMDMGVNGSHYAGAHDFLFEGNWGDNCDSDETHGNAIYHTFFRNDCTGLRTPFTDPSNGYAEDDATGHGYQTGGNPPSPVQPAPLRAAGPMAFDYWMAYVGNVLGTPGASGTTSANGWAYQCAFGATGGQTNKCIWMSGWVGSEWPAPDPHLTAGSGAYIFRHGDYDYVNDAIEDWTSGYSHTLPNSFYLSAEPAFFEGGAHCTYPWPWVTPTGSTPIQSPTGAGCTADSALPAKARYGAGTPFVQP